MFRTRLETRNCIKLTDRAFSCLSTKPAMHWLDPVGDGHPVKVNCCQQWWVTLNLSGAVGVVKEGERMRAQARLVGEGQGILLEKIRRGYGEITWR